MISLCFIVSSNSRVDCRYVAMDVMMTNFRARDKNSVLWFTAPNGFGTKHLSFHP